MKKAIHNSCLETNEYMLEQDLVYKGMAFGRKPHYIFTQNDEYYEITLMEGDTRGNCHVYTKNEVERIQRIFIAEESKSKKLFLHPEDLTEQVREFYDHLKPDLNSEQDIKKVEQLKQNHESFIVSRIRGACYVLQAESVLIPCKVGNSINFCTTQSFLLRSSKSKSTNKFKLNSDANKPAPITNNLKSCEYCGDPVSEKKYLIHITDKCRKRPNLS